MRPAYFERAATALPPALLALALPCVLAGSASAQQVGTPTLGRTGQLYTEASGYFTFVAPGGWIHAREVEGPSTSVRFHHPAVSAVSLTITVMAKPRAMNATNFTARIRNDVETGRSRAGGQRGSVIGVETDELHGFPAVFARQSRGKAREELTYFYAGEVIFRTVYGAPDATNFDRYRHLALQSLDTLVVDRRVSTAGLGDRRAMYATAVETLAEAGDYDKARAFVDAALREHPEDARLKKLEERVRALQLVWSTLETGSVARRAAREAIKEQAVAAASAPPPVAEKKLAAAAPHKPPSASPARSRAGRRELTLQVGAFRRSQNAAALKDRLSQAVPDVYVAEVESGGATLYRVRVGTFATLADTRAIAARLEAAGYKSVPMPKE